MLEKLVFDALIRERAGRVEAERTKVTREHFHRRDAAGLDRLDELGPRRERKVLAAPEAEALGVGEVVDGGRACRRDVDDAGARQRSEEHTSELQSLLRIPYAVFCLKKKKRHRSDQRQSLITETHQK